MAVWEPTVLADLGCVPGSSDWNGTRPAGFWVGCKLESSDGPNLAVVSLDASMISEKKDSGISAKGSAALTTKPEWFCARFHTGRTVQRHVCSYLSAGPWFLRPVMMSLNQSAPTRYGNTDQIRQACRSLNEATLWQERSILWATATIKLIALYTVSKSDQKEENKMRRPILEFLQLQKQGIWMERMFSVQFWSILETCRKLIPRISLSIPESTTFYVSYWVMSGANCFACLCTVSIEKVWYRTVDPSLVALLYGSCRIYFASL